jgi:hypothetical protein
MSVERWSTPEKSDPIGLPGLLRPDGDRRKHEAERENDREPVPPHKHLVEGRLAGV